jgi:hypothetical protein
MNKLAGFRNGSTHPEYTQRIPQAGRQRLHSVIATWIDIDT